MNALLLYLVAALQYTHLSGFNKLLHIAAAAQQMISNEPTRYLLIATSGGLNQQRTGVPTFILSPHSVHQFDNG